MTLTGKSLVQVLFEGQVGEGAAVEGLEPDCTMEAAGHFEKSCC